MMKRLIALFLLTISLPATSCYLAFTVDRSNGRIFATSADSFVEIDDENRTNVVPFPKSSCNATDHSTTLTTHDDSSLVAACTTRNGGNSYCLLFNSTTKKRTWIEMATNSPSNRSSTSSFVTSSSTFSSDGKNLYYATKPLGDDCRVSSTIVVVYFDLLRNVSTIVVNETAANRLAFGFSSKSFIYFAADRLGMDEGSHESILMGFDSGRDAVSRRSTLLLLCDDYDLLLVATSSRLLSGRYLLGIFLNSKTNSSAVCAFSLEKIDEIFKASSGGGGGISGRVVYTRSSHGATTFASISAGVVNGKDQVFLSLGRMDGIRSINVGNESVVGSETSIEGIVQLELSAKGSYLYALTDKSQVISLVTDCRLLTNCALCLTKKSIGCGWCHSEQKCSLLSDCKTKYWIASNVSVSKKSLDYCRLYETGCDVIVDAAAAAPRCASCRDGYYKPEKPITTTMPPNPTTPAATTKTITTKSTLSATTTKINATTTTTTQTNTTTTTQSTLASTINTTMTSLASTTANPPSTVKATTVPTFATTFAPVLINVTCFPCSGGCSVCQNDVECTECKNGYIENEIEKKCEEPATVSTTETATITNITSTVNETSSPPPKDDDNVMLYIIIGASSGGGLILIILLIVCIVCCARAASNRRGKLVVSDDLTFVNVQDSVTRGDVQRESISPMQMNPLREIKDPEAPPVPERPATRFPFPPSSRSPSRDSLIDDLTGNTKEPSKATLVPPVPPPRPPEDDEIYLEVDADSPNNDRKRTFIASRSKIAPGEEEAYYIDGRQKTTAEENEDDAYYIDTSDVADKRNVERVPSDAYVAFTGKSEPLNSTGEDELYIGLDETPKEEEDDIYEAPDENLSAPPPRAVAKKPLLRAPTPKKGIVSPVETKPEEKTPNWKADVEKLKRQLVTGESEDRDDSEQLYQNIPARRSMTESNVDPRRSGSHENERGRLSTMPVTSTGYEEEEELYQNTDSAIPEEEELYGNQDTIDGVSSPQLDDIYGNQDVIAGQEEQPIYGNA